MLPLHSFDGAGPSSHHLDLGIDDDRLQILVLDLGKRRLADTLAVLEPCPVPPRWKWNLVLAADLGEAYIREPVARGEAGHRGLPDLVVEGLAREGHGKVVSVAHLGHRGQEVMQRRPAVTTLG